MKQILLLVLIIGCSVPNEEKDASKVLSEVKYASTFHFEQSDNKRFLVVDEPWPNASKPIKYDLPKSPKRIVCTSTSHLPFFELLGAEELVVGFPNLKYISSDVFIERGNQGLLTDLGPDGSMNMELLLGLNPDMVVAFDMGENQQLLIK